MPDIHTWWPALSITAKHALEEHAGEPLPDDVRIEIGAITGDEPPAGTRLSASDVDFITTQREQVD